MKKKSMGVSRKDTIELDFLELSEHTIGPMLENDVITDSEEGFLRGYFSLQ